MSSPNEPADKSKPVLKDKNPHNYRKVGFSMIVISVSLVLIGLLVWAIGSDYHFASNIMADQEVDAMTPKAGYQIVLYDYSQPIGAKLKLLDHADSLDAAQQLQNQYIQQNTDVQGQVLLFGTDKSANVDLMANAEVAAMTPKKGYNIILFNTAYPVGAKLTNVNHQEVLENATQYQQLQTQQNKDPDVKVELFTPVFTDNLKSVTGSGVPVPAYAAFANQTSAANILQTTNPSVAVNATTTVVNSTNTTVQPIIPSNQTSSTVEKTSVNATVSTIVLPKANQNNTNVAPTNATIGKSKTATLDEKISVSTSTGK